MMGVDGIDHGGLELLVVFKIMNIRTSYIIDRVGGVP